MLCVCSIFCTFCRRLCRLRSPHRSEHMAFAHLRSLVRTSQHIAHVLVTVLTVKGRRVRRFFLITHLRKNNQDPFVVVVVAVIVVIVVVLIIVVVVVCFQTWHLTKSAGSAAAASAGASPGGSSVPGSSGLSPSPFFSTFLFCLDEI